MTALLKQPVIRAPALMVWARDHHAGCQVRIPGRCAWGPTIGSHVPSGVRFGKGTAHKPHDLVCLACDTCHKIVDGQIKTEWSDEFVKLCWLEGFVATIVLAIQERMMVIN